MTADGQSLVDHQHFGNLGYRERGRIVRRDAYNRLRYGRLGPRFAERLWVRVSDIRHAMSMRQRNDLGWRHDASALVVNSWPALDLVPIEQRHEIRDFFDYVVDGKPFEETREYQRILHNLERRGHSYGITRRDQIGARFGQITALHEQLRRDGRISPREELCPKCFREYGGIMLNIAPDGTPIFNLIGCHRIASAMALGFSYIPAQIGAVSVEALPRVAQMRVAPEPLDT